MNYGMMRYILCNVLMFEGIFLMVPGITGLCYREKTTFAYLVVAAGCLAIGGLLRLWKPRDRGFFAQEGLVTVALSWILLGLVGAIPFYLTGEYPSYIDSVFECFSGLTTTGAGVLQDIEVLSHCNLMWRCFTHWIGGMGVLVLMMAVLPLSGSTNIFMMRAEAPGPTVGKIVPRVRKTASILYIIYVFITVAEIIALLFTGRNFFESVALSFSTVGTGGFGLVNSSVADYGIGTQTVIIIFMLLCSINFYVYYLLLTRRFKEALGYEEMRVFLIIVAIAVIMISIDTMRNWQDEENIIHRAVFMVTGIISTTGFTIVNYDMWPQFSKCVLLGLMMIGACAGSTGGGIKISRFMIMMRAVKNEATSLTHPRSVKKVHLNGKNVPDTVIKDVLCYFSAYILIVCISYLIVSLDNYDSPTNLSAVITSISNVGPGLGLISPVGDFGVFSTVSKIVLIIDMLAGRLEIFPVLVLVMPHTWRRV